MDDDDDKNEILTDPAIKLFGKSIQLPETSSVDDEPRITSDDDAEDRRSCGMDSGLEDELDDEGILENKEPDEELEDVNSQQANKIGAASGTIEILDKPVNHSKASSLCSSRAEEENSDTAVPEENTLKKPDKIIPCPRCDSMDTKFCYFNNYNVNQPRYFCRKCQRYWTSGGTMRNLPVGAGRRKSKCSAAHYPNPMMAAPLDNRNASVPPLNGTLHHPVAINGAILSFTPDQHINQISPSQAVELARRASIQNDSTNPVTDTMVIIDDNTTGTAGSVSNIENEDESKAKAKANTAQSYQGFYPQMVCYPAPLWPPFPLNPAQYNYPLPGPIDIRPGFPMPFYPAPMYMGCAVPGAWNVPWSSLSPSPSTQPDPRPPTLGKHSREDSAAKSSSVVEDKKRKDGINKSSLWVPKTLRIDELEEAAKSSMWATLGIKTDDIVSAGGKGPCKPFSSLTNQTSLHMTTSSSLLANPAALSRSMNFREST